MANNYRSFSEQIENLTDEEIDWLERQTDTVRFRSVAGPDPEQEVLEIALTEDDENYEEEGMRFLVEAVGDAEQARLVDDFGMIKFTEFGYELDKQGRTLWLFAEENGDVGQVAILVQQFLRTFRPHESFSLTAADYCSKPRLGEFGGAAAFITATEILLMSTGDWVAEQRIAFDKAAKSKSADQNAN
ncbi:MAG: hypothetical protein MI757_00180 [Pirellulales bacterium]|nr:hypothetical protein [Pirellulales bacterium]